MAEPPILLDDFKPESRNISNSEVSTFLSCKRMYDFAFIENLEPKKQSHALSRGTLGHACFEEYIKARLNGASHERALKVVDDFLVLILRTEQAGIDLVGEVKYLFARYMEFHHGWPNWKLLGTEERVDLKLTDTINIPIRYDILVEDIASGKILMGDWKFTYEFWTQNDHALNPQMPKYLAVMAANGIRVDEGFIEEVRTRKLSDANARDPQKVFRRTRYKPSHAQKLAVMRQHLLTSNQIEEHRALDPEFRKLNASIPVLNKYGPCKYCSFADLCNSMNTGATDLTVAIRENFQPNTYGYNKDEEATTQGVGF